MPGGFITKRSRKDYIAEQIFGAAPAEPLVSLGRVKELQESPLAQFPIFQSYIPSCVTCSATFINMWNSWKAGTFNPLSWPFLYANVRHFPGGTIPQDSFNVLKKVGQCSHARMMQETYWEAPYLLDDNKNVLPEWVEEAAGYKVASYVFIENKTIQGIYPYLKDAPVMIGIHVDRYAWTDLGVNQPGRKDFGHAVALIDVEPDGTMVVVSWDKKDKLDIRKLSPDYPILLAVAVVDLPDTTASPDIRRGTALTRLFRTLCTA